MTVVLRDFKRHEISEDELKLLLSFVEEDIHDYQRQSTAFPLLKVVTSCTLGHTQRTSFIGQSFFSPCTDHLGS